MSIVVDTSRMASGQRPRPKWLQSVSDRGRRASFERLVLRCITHFESQRHATAVMADSDGGPARRAVCEVA